MTKKLMKAWDKTKRKWEQIIKNNGKIFEFSSACGLCNVFDMAICEGCPVKKMTGDWNCKNTPYWEWRKNKTLENAEVEYLFLLFVYEATKRDKE